MVPEAPLESTSAGTATTGEGWFVLGAADARWLNNAQFGAYTRFEGEPASFPTIGINIGVLSPGQPACYYHGEDAQEDFLILSGEALLVIEGEERRLKAWDFVHCPAWTEHVFIGAGESGCTILAIGSRLADAVVYPASPLAQQHGAGVERETRNSKEAYAGIPQDEPVPFQSGWLPD